MGPAERVTDVTRQLRLGLAGKITDAGRSLWRVTDVGRFLKVVDVAGRWVGLV